MTKIEINGQIVEVPDDFNKLSQSQQQAYVDDIAADMAKKQQATSPSQQMAQIQAFGRYLENQDIKNSVQGMSGFEKFLQSASLQANKALMGVEDLLGFDNGIAVKNTGAPTQARGIDYLERYNNALSEDSPVTNIAGRTVGGIMSAAPLALGAEGVVPAGLGFLGRTGLSALLGGTEASLEMPFSGETRLSNAVEGTIAATIAEPLSIALQAGLKRIPFGALNPFKGNQVEDTVKQVMKDMGLDYELMKPETKKILKSISNSEDIDAAVRNAMETEYGFKLTLGESTGDFRQLSEEARAARTTEGAGDTMRDFKEKQNEAIITASGALAEDAGGKIATNEAMGTALKDALGEAKKFDRANYQDLYKEAARISSDTSIDIPLSSELISKEFYRLAADHMNTDGAMLKDIGNKLARYNILDPKDFNTEMPFTIPDVDVNPLGVSNSEDFIKYLNSLYSNDPRSNMILGQLKDVVEQSADNALAQALKDGGANESADQFLKAARQAREANRAYRGLWEAKDVLQDITGFKPNTKTPLKDASEIVALIRRKPENAERVITELTERGNIAAIEDLRTFMLKDLFDASINPNQVSGEGVGFFSGSKLTSLIKKQEAVLQKVLSPDQYAQLKLFEKQVGKATKKPAGTVNYSGSGYVMFDTLLKLLKATPILNSMATLERFGAEKTVRDAIRSGTRKEIDYVLKLDQNHVKLNTLLREVIDQSLFADESMLAE